MGLYDETTRDDLVTEARLCWDALYDWRYRRARCRNYIRNKPDELTTDRNGNIVYEDDLVASQGRIPMHLNRIGKIVKNLQGQYRGINRQRMAYGRNREDNDAADQMSEALRAVTDVNEAAELDAYMILEMLFGGLYGWKCSYQWIPEFNRYDVYLQNLDLTKFFYNPDIADRRFHDLVFCGELHDCMLDEVIQRFAKTEEEAARIKNLLSDNQEWSKNQANYVVGFSSRDTLNFYNANDPRKHRIIELWKKEWGWKNFLHDTATATCEESDLSPEQVEYIEKQRQAEALRLGLTPPPPIEQDAHYEPIWHVYYLTPMGHILYESRCPYENEKPPYTIGIAEMIDGEIWGPVEDMIDPQRFINRLNSMIDYAYGTSAKGVLLVHEDAIPEGMDLSTFAEEWTSFNGVIKFRGKPGVPIPQQVIQRALPEGIFTWLESLIRELRETSGVQQANMGIAPVAGTPASSYQAQIQQGNITNREYFDSFFATRRRRDLKIVQLIAQYYDEVTRIAVSGKRADGSKYITYDPSRIRGIEWDLIITEAEDTPATRQLSEEFLANLLGTNRITFGQYLQMNSHPKADLIMKVIQQTNPLLADVKVGVREYGQLYAQLQTQAQGGNKDAIALLEQAT